MSYTKGPWVAVKYPDVKSWTVAANGSIAKIKTEADAHLIAAAPDLLSALQQLLEMRGVVGKHECAGWDCSICTGNWGVAEKAIAKAKGEK